MTEYEERIAELSSIMWRVFEGNDVLMYAFILMIVDIARDSLPQKTFQYFIDSIKKKLNYYL